MLADDDEQSADAAHAAALVMTFLQLTITEAESEHCSADDTRGAVPFTLKFNELLKWMMHTVLSRSQKRLLLYSFHKLLHLACR